MDNSVLLTQEGAIDKTLSNLIEGKRIGFSWGEDFLDRYLGYIEPYQINVIGAYSGTGKSYYLLYLLDKILNSEVNKSQPKSPKLAIFSTEMSQVQYISRILAMKVGIWKNELVKIQTDEQLRERVISEKENLFRNFMENENSLRIVGNITSWEQIEKQMELWEKEDKKPNVIAIDYIQALNVRGASTQQEIMDVLGTRLIAFCNKYRCALIIISQMNNYSVNKVFNQSDNIIAPFSYGKTMFQSAHNAVILTRAKVDGQYTKVLQLHVVKAREGEHGMKFYEIERGFNLHGITVQQAKILNSGYTSENE